MKLSWICCKLINIIIHWPPFLKTSKGVFKAIIPNYHKFTMCRRLFMCSNIVKVSKHDCHAHMHGLIHEIGYRHAHHIF